MTQLDLFASDPTGGLKSSHGLVWHAQAAREHFRAVVTTRSASDGRGGERRALCGGIHRRAKVGGRWRWWIPIYWFNDPDRMHEVIHLGGLHGNRWPCAESP